MLRTRTHTHTLCAETLTQRPKPARKVWDWTQMHLKHHKLGLGLGMTTESCSLPALETIKKCFLGLNSDLMKSRRTKPQKRNLQAQMDSSSVNRDTFWLTLNLNISYVWPHIHFAFGAKHLGVTPVGTRLIKTALCHVGKPQETSSWPIFSLTLNSPKDSISSPSVRNDFTERQVLWSGENNANGPFCDGAHRHVKHRSERTCFKLTAVLHYSITDLDLKRPRERNNTL